MSNSMYNNACSAVPTHFLTGAALIEDVLEAFGTPSERWAYPIGVTAGHPQETFYGEVWVNGMDWQDTYWAVFRSKFGRPSALPMIEREDDKVKFNRQDLEELLRALLMVWRCRCGEAEWVDMLRFNDTVWAYLKYDRASEKNGMIKATFGHASQPQVSFLLNPSFLPLPEKDEPLPASRD